MGAPTDRELVLAAQRGEVAALGALLERHEAVLLAEALRRVGGGPAARDAVQETYLVALRRIGDVRDPDAARAWLLAILRNVCRMAWRTSPPPAEPLDEGAVAAGAGRTPEAELERLATRDWVWTALGALPEPLRVTVMLRHFGRWSSYGEIADILGVPVGTVRSRLSIARGRLAEALAATADGVHTEAAAVRRREACEFAAAAAELNAGTGFEALSAAYAADVRAELPGGVCVHGKPAVRASLAGDVEAGTRLQVQRVLASGTITVVEAALENRPDAPRRCPPATCQVHVRPDGRTTSVRLYFTAR